MNCRQTRRFWPGPSRCWKMRWRMPRSSIPGRFPRATLPEAQLLDELSREDCLQAGHPADCKVWCCYHNIALQQQMPPNQQFSIVLLNRPGRCSSKMQWVFRFFHGTTCVGRQELAWEMLCEWLSVPQGSEPKAWLEGQTAIDPLVIGDIGAE